MGVFTCKKYLPTCTSSRAHPSQTVKRRVLRRDGSCITLTGRAVSPSRTSGGRRLRALLLEAKQAFVGSMVHALTCCVKVQKSMSSARVKGYSVIILISASASCRAPTSEVNTSRHSTLAL